MASAARRAHRQRPANLAELRDQLRVSGSSGGSAEREPAGVGKGKLSARRLSSAAITALIDGQAAADRAAGLDWRAVTTPASTLDERLARAHATLPVDLDDPRVWAYQLDQRRVLARPLGLDDDRADDLSRWLLAHPSQFDAGDLRGARDAG